MKNSSKRPRATSVAAGARSKRSASRGTRVGLSRERVLNAAMEMINRDGIDGLTIATLARALSVQPPSLYNHLQSLEDLRRAMTLRAMQQLRDELRIAAVGLAREDALRAVAHAYRRFAKEASSLYQLLQRALDPTDNELHEAAQQVVQVVASVLKGYGIVGEDVLHLVRVFRSALHGFISLEIAGGFGLPLDQDRSFACLLTTMELALPHWSNKESVAEG